MARTSQDLTQGPVVKKLFLFAMPILFTNMLQQLYHAADVMVVGNFAEDATVSLAAVGSTGAVTTLLLNLFIGLSLGVNVICANCYGAGDREGLNKTMQTGLITSLFSGIIVSLLGFFLARPCLLLLGSPESVIGPATTYMKIVFLGQPGSLVYNFGAGILRAHGDTKRPMMILSFAGMINVVLNLVFVIVFHLDSAGVALATSISHYFSAAAVLFILCNPNGEQRLSLFDLHFDRKQFLKIMRVGIPGGLNGMVFSVSNTFVAKGVNTLGAVVIAGNSAASSVDYFTYQILLSFYTACVSFAGQNYGAKKFRRIDRLLWSSILMTAAIYAVVFGVIACFPEFFVGLFSKDPVVVRAGLPRLYMIGTSYLIYTVSEMAIGCLRGMGKSFLPTALNAASVCIPRIVWVTFIFPLRPTLLFLYMCFPISYVFSITTQLGCYLYYSKKEKKAYYESQKAALPQGADAPDAESAV